IAGAAAGSSPAAAPNSDTVIQYNAIGTDGARSAPIGNGGSGIYIAGASGVLVGGDVAYGANIIAGNAQDGVTLAERGGVGSDGNHIERNTIGLGTPEGGLGNGRHGVNIISGSNNLV